MRAALVILLLAGAVLSLALIPTPAAPRNDLEMSPGMRQAVDHFRQDAPLFAKCCKDLQTAISTLKPSDPATIRNARIRLADCRYTYKRIEYFLEYFFPSSARIFNRAPKFEAEEPDMEYQSPLGLQVIETLLYDKMTPDNQRELKDQAAAVASSAADLPALLYGFQGEDRQLLESLRLELIRIITLDITGYEAPFLKTGIAESRLALQTIDTTLTSYLKNNAALSDSLHYFLHSSIASLAPGTSSSPKAASSDVSSAASFDAFPRLNFLRTQALPLQRLLHRFIRLNDLSLLSPPFSLLNTRDGDLFSSITSDVSSTAADVSSISTDEDKSERANTLLIEKGRQLFLDRRLSGNGQRSCASCHSPGKFFTDGLKTSLALDGHSALPRNAPSLLYAGFQYQQFWDGRAPTLERQIELVLEDPREMQTSDSVIKHLAPIATAIAAYLRSLHPMNSRFDRYLHQTASILSADEIKGADLFLGKAQCATCHFMPLFNGLIPPDYVRTEYEVLGTTRTDLFNHPRLSPDSGRFTVYPFPFYMGAFKTPTVRNSANTGPYMHNGAFRSLEKVMEFYNKGGGAGLGLSVPAQTLTPRPLGLSPREIKDIILFLHTLTDSLPPVISSRSLTIR